MRLIGSGASYHREYSGAEARWRRRLRTMNTMRNLTTIERLPWATEPRWMPCPKRVHTVVQGQVIADSSSAYLYRDLLPIVFFPASDVRVDLLKLNSSIDSILGKCELYDVELDSNVPLAAWKFTDARADVDFLNEHFAFKWQAMDAWFEEGHEIHEHIRDPFSRIDTVSTDSLVEVMLAGVQVARSTNATLLLEPGLPVRFYLPPEDVRTDLIHPTEIETACPYKGTAKYFTVKVAGSEHKDIAWTYQRPLRDASEVAGLICFFNERVDAITVDGANVFKPVNEFTDKGDAKDAIPVPMTPWSPPKPL